MCYNEEGILSDSVQKIVDVLDSTRFSYEIIFVDDCSEDNTRSLIDQLVKKKSDQTPKNIPRTE